MLYWPCQGEGIQVGDEGFWEAGVRVEGLEGDFKAGRGERCAVCGQR